MKAFPDEADIAVQGGSGGAGCVSFRRARHQPRGRPDGGNGGAGGDVYLEASQHTRTLSYFRRKKKFQGENGRPGQSQDCQGRQGALLVIAVPPGTLVYDRESQELLAELITPGERLLVAKGGRGGKGNAHFASSSLRSPRFAQPGEPGQERRLRLELQVLADVGLMGAPNAGKSTLLTSLTASRARVAAFPFTTLTPQLGVLMGSEEAEPLVLAEIPGLIPGAHLGKGLGHRLLRHLKRTRLLVQVIDVSDVQAAEPLQPLHGLEVEMRAFDPELLARPRIIVLNKIDLLPPDFPKESVLAAYRRTGLRVFPVSALTGQGLPELEAAIRQGAAHLMEKREGTEEGPGT